MPFKLFWHLQQLYGHVYLIGDQPQSILDVKKCCQRLQNYRKTLKKMHGVGNQPEISLMKITIKVAKNGHVFMRKNSCNYVRIIILLLSYKR